jgi:hypothetical protein
MDTSELASYRLVQEQVLAERIHQIFLDAGFLGREGLG